MRTPPRRHYRRGTASKSRCGLGRLFTDQPDRVTCRRCRHLAERDDPPADRGRWRQETAR